MGTIHRILRQTTQHNTMADTTNNNDKTVLVTGGSRGIGKAIAEAAVAAGHPVIVTYRTDAEQAAATVAELEAAHEGARVAALVLDVTAFATFTEFATKVNAQVGEWESTLWGLVNNGRLATNHTIDATTEEQFDLMSDVHFKGPFFLVQAFLASLVDGGRIVNITTGLSRFTMPGY